MVKRRRVVSTEQDIKVGDHKCSVDRISMLPDELLVYILSFLTFKQAMATSILSPRWRYLWALTSNLDFDGHKLLLKVHSSGLEWLSVLETEKRNYVGWVDRVLALHESSNLEIFRVYFNLDKAYKKHIDKWLRYALARKVQRLELDLTDKGCDGFRDYDDNYTFPCKYLHTDKGKNCFRSLSFGMRQCDSVYFKYLRNISLKHVNVNDEALEFFLYNCPLLEDLTVSHSGQLSNLKIIGPLCPSFKRLEIIWCNNLDSVEICDANLVCFKYVGWGISSFVLRNVPMLVEVSVGGCLTKRMSDVHLMFLDVLAQLEKFRICFPINFFHTLKEIRVLYSSVKMGSLKHLVVSVLVLGDDSLLRLTNLIRASRRQLQSFTLEASRPNPKFVKRKIKKIVRPYPQLKEVALRFMVTVV